MSNKHKEASPSEKWFFPSSHDPNFARLTWRFEQKGDTVSVVIGSDSDGVIVRGTLQDLWHAGQVDAERQVPVASVVLESLGLEHEWDEGHVRAVHSLQAHSIATAVPWGLVQQVLDGFHHLFQQASFN